MARIRTIKPEWWTQESVIECSMNARLLYLGMNNFADDQGNIEGHLGTVKALVFPADSIDVRPLLLELCRNEMLIPYQEVTGEKTRTYYHITTFDVDQRIDRPGKPRCPDFDQSKIVPHSFLEHSTTNVDEHSTNNHGGKGREGRGIGRDKPITPFVRKFSDWDLTMANTMINDIVAIAPQHNFNGGNAEKWADVFRMMREIDKLPEAEIEGVWVWANRSQFWQSNILSPGKLREKFSQLKLKMAADKPDVSPGQAYDGISQDEPLPHNELAEKINTQILFAQDHLKEDLNYLGAKPDINWLNMAVGNLILEYSDRWPKGPYMRQFEQKFGDLTNRVMELET